MIYYRGWGILVVVIGVLCFAATAIAVGAATGDKWYYEDHRWPKMVGCVATAAVVWPVGRWFNAAARSTPLGDEVADEQLARIQMSRHALLFIPMEYWAIIVLFFGAAFWLKP